MSCTETRRAADDGWAAIFGLLITFPGVAFFRWGDVFLDSICFVFSHRGAFHVREIVDSFEARVYVD